MRKFKFTIHGNEYEVSIDRFEDSSAQVTVNGVSYEVDVQRQDKKPVHVERKKVVTGSGPQPVRMKPQPSAGALRAPLPGVLKELKVKEGDEVKEGDLVAVLEAMKMENDLYAPSTGRISKINFQPGQNVLEDEVVLTVE